jgi:type I restriction enzyme S subunit
METISKITDIGQIPSDWNIKTIEQLFENGFQNGVFFEVDRKGKGIPIVNVSDLYGSVPIDGRKLEKFNATEKEIERFIVHKGDLFFTRSSVVPAGIAMCNVYDDKDENGAVFDSHVIKLSVNQQEVNSLFLCLQCRMPYCRSFFIANSKTAIMTTIDQKSLAKCPIPMPQLSEQDDIVGTIRRFDTYIDDLAELIEKKRGIRDGALEDMMSGRIRLQGFTADWVVYPFSKYFSLLPTNTCSRDQLSDRGQVGDIHYGDVLIKYGDVLSDADEIPRLKDVLRIKERSFLKMHDVLIADTAEDETVGKAVQVGKVSIPLVGGLHTVACRPNYETAEGFLGYYLNSSQYHEQLYPYITGIKVSSISKKSFGETELCIPAEVEEQKAIVSVLKAIDEEIEALEIERDKMIQIREGAMDDLLTGRVRLSV